MPGDSSAIAPLMVSEAETARLLGVSQRTVFSLRKSGSLRAVKIGTRNLYPLANLQDFIARNIAKGRHQSA